MIIYPAMDLRQGQCIRLYQGDYERETVYSLDPFHIANHFIEEGADWLHLIDLDGAKDSDKNQSELIFQLIKESGVKVQTGGGVRYKSQIKNLLEQGAARVIIGSMAVTHQQEVATWFTYFGSDKLVLALDVRLNENKQPMITINAWQTISPYSLYELIEYYKTVGLVHLLCTNITLDGTLNGPDDMLYETLLQKFPFLELQASGGIASLKDITKLREKKLSGAIIGRALYEKKFTMREVLAC